MSLHQERFLVQLNNAYIFFSMQRTNNLTLINNFSMIPENS